MVMTQLDPNGLLAATAIVIIVTIVALTNYFVKWKRGELKKKKKVVDSPPAETTPEKTSVPQTETPSLEKTPDTSKSDKDNIGV